MREIALPLAFLFAAACSDAGSPPSSSGGSSPPSASATTSSPASTSPAEARSLLGLKASVPKAWQDAGPQSTMSPSVKLILPKAEGDAADGSLRIFKGAMGPKDANIQRWIGQMTQPDGKNSQDVAKVRDVKSGPLNVTLLDISGTFTDSMGGMTPGPPQPKFRMLAAFIDGQGQTWYAKATGPEKTMARWHDDLESLFSTLAPE
jgi:hypothetical protein